MDFRSLKLATMEKLINHSKLAKTTFRPLLYTHCALS